MTTRIPVEGRAQIKAKSGNGPDPVKYVGRCLCGRWQVQAGLGALRSAGRRGDLFILFAEAHHEHILEAHPAGMDHVEFDFDGDVYPAAQEQPDGGHRAAMLMEPLPRWWEDWS